jgi:hypothetical protein
VIFLRTKHRLRSQHQGSVREFMIHEYADADGVICIKVENRFVCSAQFRALAGRCPSGKTVRRKSWLKKKSSAFVRSPLAR